MAKILYFEGAGCSLVGEVENCRIRTAFRNYEGKAIYLELCGYEHTLIDGRFAGTSSCIIMSCHHIYDNDMGKYERLNVKVDIHSSYTHEGILRVVNSLGCSFDKIVVLPQSSEFRVHANPGYNYGDEYDCQ
jgi:hypothetical protein